MKLNVSFSFFTDLFQRYGRGNNFSLDNMEALYYYLEEVYAGDYVLDVIELCCTYRELTVKDIINEYSLDDSEASELKSLENDTEVLEWLVNFGINVINVDFNLNVLTAWE